jgi:hypothetical protein
VLEHAAQPEAQACAQHARRICWLPSSRPRSRTVVREAIARLAEQALRSHLSAAWEYVRGTFPAAGPLAEAAS